VLLAAAVVATTVVGVVVLAPDDPAAPRARADAGPREPATAEWRTEHWHDVAVDVPADWWYGGGPMRDSLGPMACFPEPIVDASGVRREGRSRDARGWVGRPIGLTDVCVGVDDGPPPDLPYLWFDAPVDTGTVELGDGWTRETIAVNGSKVTVATRDDGLRRRILGSTTGGETCFSELEDVADPLAPPPPPIEGDRPTVCAYRESDGKARLTYATRLSTARADRFVAAVDEAPPAPDIATRACERGDAGFEWAVVYVAGQAYVVRTGFHGCPHVQRGDRFVRLTADVVEPWAVGGISAVMVGPTGGTGTMLESFIGPLG